MDSLKELNEIFKEVFNINDSELNEHLCRDECPVWDSIHQLSLLTYLEDCFDIMLDGEDALGITSYNGCKNLLSEKYGIEF